MYGILFMTYGSIILGTSFSVSENIYNRYHSIYKITFFNNSWYIGNILGATLGYYIFWKIKYLDYIIFKSFLNLLDINYHSSYRKTIQGSKSNVNKLNKI